MSAHPTTSTTNTPAPAEPGPFARATLTTAAESALQTLLHIATQRENLREARLAAAEIIRFTRHALEPAPRKHSRASDAPSSATPAPNAAAPEPTTTTTAPATEPKRDTTCNEVPEEPATPHTPDLTPKPANPATSNPTCTSTTPATSAAAPTPPAQQEQQQQQPPVPAQPASRPPQRPAPPAQRRRGPRPLLAAGGIVPVF